MSFTFYTDKEEVQLGMLVKEDTETTTGHVDAVVPLHKTSIFCQHHYYLTFYCLLPSLSTHKSVPAPPAISYHSLELKGGLPMNSKDLKENSGGMVSVI